MKTEEILELAEDLAQQYELSGSFHQLMDSLNDITVLDGIELWQNFCNELIYNIDIGDQYQSLIYSLAETEVNIITEVWLTQLKDNEDLLALAPSWARVS